MQAHQRHDRATFIAYSIGGLGMFVIFAGVRLMLVSSRRVRRAVAGIAAEGAGTIARGIRSGLATDAASRLTQLEELRGKGLVSEDEFQAKRREIVATL